MWGTQKAYKSYKNLYHNECKTNNINESKGKTIKKYPIKTIYVYNVFFTFCQTFQVIEIKKVF